MSVLTRDGTTEYVSHNQIFRRERGQQKKKSSSANHEQDWQPYPVDPFSAICDEHTYRYILVCYFSSLSLLLFVFWM